MEKKIKDKENMTIERKSIRRYVSIVHIFKIAMIVGIVSSMFIDTAAATDFGDIIGTYSGIDAKSNGPCTGKYSGIYENTDCSLRQNWIYQCIEYVKRFYRYRMGIDTSIWGGNANTYYTTASTKGLYAYPNGGNMPPQQNDILAFSGGPYGYGHVAIITEVGNTYVKVIEQNWNRDTAYATLSRNGNTIQNRGTYTVQGWLRKKSSLDNAVDYTGLGLTTGGNANWLSQTSTTHDGVDAAKSGVITHNQNTYMQAIINPTTSKTLTFWWSVSSEANYDFLTFYIDGVRKDRISGTVSWQQRSYRITAGRHTLKWVYTKDGIVSKGADAGYIDTVRIQ